MPNRPSVKSAFENLRPTIVREPTRSAVTAEAEARLLDRPTPRQAPRVEIQANVEPAVTQAAPALALQPTATPLAGNSPFGAGTLLQKKKRDRLLLVSFRMPQGLKEKLEEAAKRHELNQTDLINEAIELNLQRYL